MYLNVIGEYLIESCEVGFAVELDFFNISLATFPKCLLELDSFNGEISAEEIGEFSESYADRFSFLQMHLEIVGRY